MSPLRRRLAQAAIGFLAITATLFVAGEPAYAYPYNPRVLHAVIDTGNCSIISATIPASRISGCYIDDSYDYTLFEHDAGGIAVKYEIYDSANDLVAKVEWHPYDEKLWLYDTKNDDDYVYTQLCVGNCPAAQAHPETGALVKDYSLAEGTEVTLWTWDDSARTKIIWGDNWARA